MLTLFFMLLEALAELLKTHAAVGSLAMPLFIVGATLLQEQPLTLNDAAKRSRVNPSTAWRWALKGVRGVVLETYAMGVKRYTTVEALERFSERCTAAAAGGQSAPTVRTPAQRDRDLDRAEAELAKLGV